MTTGELTSEQKEQAAKLILRLLDPEDFGLSVTAEVRDAARRALGLPVVETKGEGK